jgi:Cys-tRNA(Pro) deacylase
MSGRVTPAVRSMEKAGVAFQLLEYDYDPSADAIGLQAAQALGRSPSTVFKTLIVALDSGELVCAIIPSDTRLNLKAIASAAGAIVLEAPPALASTASTMSAISRGLASEVPAKGSDKEQLDPIIRTAEIQELSTVDPTYVQFIWDQGRRNECGFGPDEGWTLSPRFMALKA